MLKVAITIDTEFWPDDTSWPDRPLARPLPDHERAYARDICGRTDRGDFGVDYMLQTLNDHGLHGVFFVEALSASALGGDLLRRCVRSIVGAGHEVQLHVHTEWLSEAAVPGVPQRHRQNLSEFTRDEQAAIVAQGLANLRAAGVPDVLALRAGNLGGNADTPHAARLAGLSLDMSLDPAQGAPIRKLLQTIESQGSATDACPSVPLSCVEDYRGHFRHAQLAALSFAELSNALLNAVEQKWPCFVILSHSFELLRGGRMHGTARADAINVARWNQLCAFLARHRDVMQTVGCAELLADPACARMPAPIRTQPLHTMRRVAEQLLTRLSQRLPYPKPASTATTPGLIAAGVLREVLTSSPDSLG